MAQDKIELYEIAHSLSPEKAMEGTQVSVIKAEMGTKNLVKLVYAMLDDLRVSFAIKSDTDTDEFLTDIAIKIVTDYWFLKIEELALFFYGCKEGKYGKSYGKLNAEYIFNCLSVYDEQRTESLNNKHLDVKNSIPSGGRTSDSISVKELFSHDERLAEYKKKMGE